MDEPNSCQSYENPQIVILQITQCGATYQLITIASHTEIKLIVQQEPN